MYQIFWIHFDCMQSLASIIFMYFAILAPTITFEGLLYEATENHFLVIEALIGRMAVGVAYGLFSGQPLSILGIGIKWTYTQSLNNCVQFLLVSY